MSIQLNPDHPGIHNLPPISGLLGTHAMYWQPPVNPDCVSGFMCDSVQCCHVGKESPQ